MFKFIFLIIALLLMSPLAAFGADTDVGTTSNNGLALSFFENQSRTRNSWNQFLALSDGKGRFNKRDCIDKDTVEFNFVTNIDENVFPNKEIRLYVSCASPSDTCVSFPVERGKDKKISFTISELFGADLECSGTSNSGKSVWLGVDLDGDRDPWLFKTKSNYLYIAWDMDNPEPPVLKSLGVGDKKFTATWEDGVVASSMYVLYYPHPGQSIAVDVPTDGADSDDEVDTGDFADGGDDADAGPSASTRTLEPMYAASEAADTEPAKCPSDTGDVREGDTFDPTADSKYQKETGKKGSDATITGLTNEQPYIVGLVLKDAYNNYSTISNTLCVTPMPTENFFDIYKDAGGKGGKFCFVATAAFGSYDHPAVQLLRMFRDRFLAKLPYGESVIAAYYRIGPEAAAAVENHPMLRAAAAGLLAAFAGFTVPLSLLGPVGSLFALLLLGATLIGFKFRFKSKR